MRRFILALILLVLPSCHQKVPQPPKTLKLNLSEDPISLDPRVVRSLKDLTVVKQLFEGLMRMNQKGIPQPAIAESIEISDDLLTYTFSLRKAYWTNGDPVSAHDFAYAWKTVLDPAFATDYSYMLYPIKNGKKARLGMCSAELVGVYAPDDTTLIVELEAPTPYFLELTAFPTYFPVNRKIDCINHDWAQLPCENFVCNGPFTIKKWNPQSEIFLDKNLNYWDQEKVRLDAIRFLILNDNNTAYQLFEKNELDWLGQPIAQNISTDRIGQKKKKNELNSYPVAGTFWFKFNTEKEPFNHVLLRKAFSFAINREQIITHILQGNQSPATGPLPPSMRLQDKPYFKDGDRDKASELFEKALIENHWTRESFPPVILSYVPSERNNKIVQTVQQQWQEAFGILVKLEAVELQLYRRNVKQGHYQVGTGDWIADFNDPLAFLELFKFRNQDGNGMNETGWHDPMYSDLLSQSLRETNPVKRASLLNLAEKILVDGMPIAPVYHYAFDYIKIPQVKDVVLSPTGTADFKYTTIE